MPSVGAVCAVRADLPHIGAAPPALRRIRPATRCSSKARCRLDTSERALTSDEEHERLGRRVAVIIVVLNYNAVSSPWGTMRNEPARSEVMLFDGHHPQGEWGVSFYGRA